MHEKFAPPLDVFQEKEEITKHYWLEDRRVSHYKALIIGDV